jgi:hypothetical protein
LFLTSGAVVPHLWCCCSSPLVLLFLTSGAVVPPVKSLSLLLISSQVQTRRK